MLLVVTPYLIVTSLMVADIFTKALAKADFYRCRDYLLNLDNGPELILYGKAARLWAKLQRHLSR